MRRIISKRRGNYLGTIVEGVADITELREVPGTDVLDRAIIIVEDTGLFRFDHGGSGVDDGASIIQPSAGPGRWFKVAGSSTAHHADLAEFTGVSSGAPAGDTIVTSALAGERAGGSEDYVGVITETPYNWVHLHNTTSGGAVVDGSGHIVYGRMTIDDTALAGTCTFTEGDTAVVGVGTAFIANVAPGQLVKADAHAETTWAEVAAVADDTHLTLVDDYEGATVAGAASSVGDWLVTYYTETLGVETAYSFGVDTPLTLWAVKSFFEDLPFASLVLKPGGLEAASTGSGSWDATDQWIGDGIADTFNATYDNIDLSAVGHLLTVDGLVMELGTDYSMSDGTGPAGVDQVVLAFVPALGIKIGLRYARI